MKKLVTTAMAVAMVATSMVPAMAQPSKNMKQRQQYVESYCARSPNSADCRDFRANRNRWDNARYQRWYRDHHDNGDAAAAALFGLAAGAILGAAASSAANSSNSAAQAHVDACQARYRSYDVSTDSYLGNDGLRHRCQL
ncbi:BA14K family protein [Propylenella binzhouense]|uniref:Lectin-like protein BA14k n=1 Tax=Propylenella binzhouense TaxID=2555902 RepID=A0A964T2M7_9HYPH|nr:BA14K family protein [Propylenella binzhouense]MYZ47169.1 hypothetical protein [Propylenella binzhouense]